jgi:hypothetical protein
MKAQIATVPAILSLAIVTAQPPRAASLVINDAVPGSNVMFSENDFEGGFELNGTQVQIGSGNPASQTVSENGAFVDGAAENTFSGSWIAASPIVPVSETIFITELGSALISDVLDFTYSSNPLNANTGELNGFVISDNDSTPLTVADLNAVGIFATATLSGADGPVGTFPNTGITASFQSDADGVPELPTWAMITVGFAGLGYSAFRRSARTGLATG